MTIAGAIRARRYAPFVAERGRTYAAVGSDAERSAIQLALLNSEWSRVVREVPFYERAVKAGHVPDRFESLDAFVRLVPVTPRAEVRATLEDRTSRGRKPEFRRITGGTTAEPVQLPAWYSEERFTRSDMWLGRSWYGVTPASRLFLLWGHSHLLGTGMRGWLRARRKECSDLLLGYHRYSAYDMRPERLRQAARAMVAFRPDYVLGYSVALDRFAAANADQRDALRSLRVKAIVGAAEAFPGTDAPERLADLFGSEVAMEYGSVETGLMAHTEPSGGYRVFWRTYLLDAERHHDGWRLRVTSLFPRSFPLVRYDLGDEVELGPGTGDVAIGITRIERVTGRCNDYVVLRDGAVVHSEVFTHAMRPCGEVCAYQVVQSNGVTRIDYVASSPLATDAQSSIRARLRRIHPELGGIPLLRVDDVRKTIAGKTRMVIIE